MSRDWAFWLSVALALAAAGRAVATDPRRDASTWIIVVVGFPLTWLVTSAVVGASVGFLRGVRAGWSDGERSRGN